jgi:hypothetical protein
MRNEAFAIPLDFTWKVARGGHRWVEESGKRYLCSVDAVEKPDWPGLFNRYQRVYRPLEERTGLFREFAELKPTDKQILDFVDRYGLLDNTSNVSVRTSFGRRQVRGESLEYWRVEIQALKTALTLWDAIGANRNEKLLDLKEALRSAGLPLLVHQRFHFDDPDPGMAALSIIQTVTDEKLQRHVVIGLIFSDPGPGLRLSLQPQCLLGALWQQFAASLDGSKTFPKCAECGSPFEISHARKTGKRTDARFCDVRCRVNHSRSRQKQARRMHDAGRSEREIARELKTQLKVVKGWVGGH